MNINTIIIVAGVAIIIGAFALTKFMENHYDKK